MIQLPAARLAPALTASMAAIEGPSWWRLPGEPILPGLRVEAQVDIRDTDERGEHRGILNIANFLDDRWRAEAHARVAARAEGGAGVGGRRRVFEFVARGTHATTNEQG